APAERSLPPSHLLPAACVLPPRTALDRPNPALQAHGAPAPHLQRRCIRLSPTRRPVRIKPPRVHIPGPARPPRRPRLIRHRRTRLVPPPHQPQHPRRRRLTRPRLRPRPPDDRGPLSPPAPPRPPPPRPP